MEATEMVNKIIEKHLKRRLISGRCSRSSAENGPIDRENAKKAHGTTILALKYDKGVIIASDKRCVAGETIFSDNEIKIEELDNLSCIAGAGLVSDFQWLVDILKNSVMPEFERFLETKIFVDGQANLLKELMRRALFLAWPILAGFDPFRKEGRIFLYEPGGAKFDFEDFATCGSGGEGARGVLEIMWSKNCSEEEGIGIAIEALLAASNVDRNTSPSSIRPPLIKVISSEKISDVPAKKALEIAWNIIVKEETRKGIKNGAGASWKKFRKTEKGEDKK